MLNICHSNANVVQQVHWLWGRAQHDCWAEEVILITYEMQWTVRHFQHNAGIWQQCASFTPASARLTAAGASIAPAGSGVTIASADKRRLQAHSPAAYAAQKAEMWMEMAISAQQAFIDINPSYNIVNL